MRALYYPGMSDIRRLAHVERIPIRWGDMDAMGHVNNTLYFRYLEIARLEWLYAVGGPPDPNGTGDQRRSGRYLPQAELRPRPRP